jgi:Rps23 Pro-64 3,4-dihydroxylase Tpa1-like proline 4-hydroxylase
MAVFAVVANKH